LVVTAAHCVANYGQSQFYSNWVFVPAYSNGSAPYGKWKAASASILTAYYNGTDNCTQYGVICPDDVALIVLQPNSTGGYPGPHTGWFGWGYNGYAFYNGATEITQLGYPCNLDSCALMERTDSYGFTDGSYSNNTIIGSEQEGGSSGGPWMANFGQPPNGLQGTDLGRNVVIGVTSWGFTDLTVMEQGAAPFTSGNIAFLWNFVGCPGPAYC
jgi:V8-like Glu-specific endopeptidase